MNKELGIKKKKQSGFTLMEIIVATTIFVMTSTALLSLFNYVLKINRRSEALRQASQGMRNFAEFLVKEVRNGQIDYFVLNGTQPGTGIGPCQPPVIDSTVHDTYGAKSNWLGIITPEGEEECVYFADQNGSQLPSTTFTAPSGSNYTLALEKTGGIKQTLNPPNFRIDSLMFLVRPVRNPYSPLGGYEQISPSAVIMMKFVAQLPTGEQVPIYYQTAVTPDRYDIPR
ncbi:MAG: type II secretion system GspH family protein [Patescibacteria group bacterium]|nr:type II secretion system GspH family protein [Patescibacteria group bacterium]